MKVDEYTRWYREDARRVEQVHAFERHYHHHRRIDAVCTILREQGVRNVVDMGCGDGWQSERLVARGFGVVGCDIAPERLARAQSRLPKARGFVAGDLRALPFASSSIECIYLGQVLEHLPDPVLGLRELCRVLRPGGLLILDTPCRDNPIDDAIKASGLDRRYPEVLDWSLHMDPGHIHFMTLAEIRKCLFEAGFEFIESRGAPIVRWNTPRIGNPLQGHRRLWRISDLIEAIVGLIPRYRNSGAIVVCAARRPLA